MRYMIYRVYSKIEHPDENLSERTVFYGWTFYKDLVKIFFKQRDKSKYQVIKLDDEEIAEDYGDAPSADTRLDTLVLRSVQTNEKVYIITTDKELGQYESKVHELFKDLSSLEVIKGDGNYIDMIYNLVGKYKIALDFLGYTPREFEYIFPPSVSDTEEFESELQMKHNGDISSLTKVIDKITISVESFIKVMKDDM